jgi:hypothetical protein
VGDRSSVSEALRGGEGERPAPPLTYEQTSRILKSLGDVPYPLVLVGGQAVNFWASQYIDRVPELKADAPFTSKDIDFCALPDAVKACAMRLGGRPKLATLEDMGTPNSGIVVFVDDEGHTRSIDFLKAPAGLDYKETVETAFRAEILDADSESVVAAFHVMHPVLSLKSRAYNVARLDGYQTEHARKQLRAAVLCAREYVRDLADAGHVKAASRASERIFRLARYKAGPEVFARYRINVFDAVLLHPSFPPAFGEKRYPQMAQQVAWAQARAVKAEQRLAAFRQRAKTLSG